MPIRMMTEKSVHQYEYPTKQAGSSLAVQAYMLSVLLLLLRADQALAPPPT